MRTFLCGVAVILGIILLAPACTYAFYLLRGDHVGVGTGYAAEVSGWIVANDLAAEECRKIRISPFALFSGPELHTLITGCIMGVARKGKDPAACELLMPSEAGMLCVGGALGADEACPLGLNREVSLGDRVASLQECVSGPREIRDHPCCLVSRARFVRTFSSCPSRGNPRIQDQCYYELAFKNTDPASCAPIQNPTLKTACTIQAKALKADPSICQGCTPPVETAEELFEVKL